MTFCFLAEHKQQRHQTTLRFLELNSLPKTVSSQECKTTAATTFKHHQLHLFLLSISSIFSPFYSLSYGVVNDCGFEYLYSAACG